MHSIRSRIAVALGVLALALAAAGPAQARSVAGPHKLPKALAAKKVTRGIMATHGKGVKVAPSSGTGVAYLTAGSTGDGPADDDECERWAGAINDTMTELREDYATDQGDVKEDVDNVNYLTEGAMDRGCFIVY